MYKELILKNGLTLVYEKLPFVRSVSFGLWIGTGSRYETYEDNGISHFIEHMLFKGTKTKTARDIAMIIDSVGGQMNAFTGKECTCIYTKTLDEDLKTAVELISDMIFHSTFDPVHIETERRIIAEEISMYEDYPEELVHDMLSEEVWNGNPLGYPILGSYASISSITREKIIDYMNTFYVPDNSVISVAGNFDENCLVELVQQYFGEWKAKNYCVINAHKPLFNRSMKVKRKETEQVHMCIGFPGIRHGEESLYSLLTLNNILGGGMSSRLFQKVREELGLAYSIYSYPTSYKDTGLFAIYAASGPGSFMDVIRHIGDELALLIIDSLTETDIEKAKNQLKGNFIISLDSTSGRMNSMGKSQLMLGRVRTPEEVLDSINKVNRDSITEVIEKVFRPGLVGLSAIGDIDFEPDLLDKIDF
ncbi:MAG: insulinase family protein [Clostridiaceae bacterium]|nr:insulinase family protein [Clostridiaceae bacterium]